MKLKTLIGSGDRIALLTAPVLAVGLAANILRPSLFSVGGPPAALKVVSAGFLVVGVTGWLWSVALIVTRVPRGELITTGPYRLVKHPLYTSVALLVLPFGGLLLDSWLGVPVGLALYVGSRAFSPAEERALASSFGAAWDAYRRGVKVAWL